jgi:colanic acid/amylovoran biosynthesis glycosyltransferase
LRSRYRGTEFWVQLGRMLPFAGLHPEVVHFEWAHWAAGFLEVIRQLPAPTVVSCRGSDLRILPLQSPRLRERLPGLFAAVDAVHCVSHELADHAVAYGARPEQIFVAPSGVDTGYFTTPRSDARSDDGVIRILSAGRLHWVKGYRYALQAVHLLRQRGHPVLYTIAGGEDGGGDEVRFTIRDLGLDGVVTVAGHLGQPALRAALAETDIFLLSSVSEGVSVATMQAMASGVPVVVTDVGGMRDAVTDGEHGFVVQPRDPRALADAVEKLILDPEASRAAGQRAADHARRRFDLNIHVDRLVAVYEDLVQQARPRPSPSGAC